MNEYEIDFLRPKQKDCKNITFKAKNDGAAIVKSRALSSGANGYRILRDGEQICRFVKGEYIQNLSSIDISLTDDDFAQINKDSDTRWQFVKMLVSRGIIIDTGYRNGEHDRRAYQTIMYDGYLWTYDVPMGCNQYKALKTTQELILHHRPQNLVRKAM